MVVYSIDRQIHRSIDREMYTIDGKVFDCDLDLAKNQSIVINGIVLLKRAGINICESSFGTKYTYIFTQSDHSAFHLTGQK